MISDVTMLIYFIFNPVNLLIHSNPGSDYSVLKLFTGFAIAAFIAWKLTVIMASKTVANAASAKTFHVIVVR